MKRVLLILALLLCSLPVWAQTPAAGHFDILIVIDSRKPVHVKTEHDMRVALEESRATHALDSKDLPVDTYDVANPGQKAAVDRLKIPDWQLPFLGLAQLGGKDAVPEKVVFGGGPVDKMEQSVGATMQEAFKRLGVKIGPPPNVSNSSPAPVLVTRHLQIMVVQGQANQGNLIVHLHDASRIERDNRGLDKERLPVFIWHEARAGVLLQRLGIGVSDTPALCVAEMQDGKPARILYRLVNVKDPSVAAHDVVGHAVQLLTP